MRTQTFGRSVKLQTKVLKHLQGLGFQIRRGRTGACDVLVCTQQDATGASEDKSSTHKRCV